MFHEQRTQFNIPVMAAVYRLPCETQSAEHQPIELTVRKQIPGICISILSDSALLLLLLLLILLLVLLPVLVLLLLILLLGEGRVYWTVCYIGPRPYIPHYGTEGNVAPSAESFPNKMCNEGKQLRTPQKLRKGEHILVFSPSDIRVCKQSDVGQ